MIDKIRSYRLWKIYALFMGAMSLGAFVLWMVFYSGLVVKRVVIIGDSPTIESAPLSLEERILEADVIARVTIRSVSSAAEHLNSEDPDVTSNNLYIGSLNYEFDVIEYLKGSGGNRIIGIVHSGYYSEVYKNQTEATRRSKHLLDTRETQWDDREAIIFLRNSDAILESVKQQGRYFFGVMTAHGDGYTINSDLSKRWLPAAKESEAGSSSGDSKLFLTGGVPLRISVTNPSGASATSNTMTLTALKTRISEIQADVTAGDGSAEYTQCLIAGYEWERRIRHHGSPKKRFNYNFESGLPANRWVYEDWGAYHVRDYWKRNPNEPLPEFWLEGRDKALFYVEHPGIVYAKRPLPKGEYKMYLQSRVHKYIVCDAYPESERTRFEYVVNVTAPAGTLHEAFFDPVAIGEGFGADATNGVLRPASFTPSGGSATTISGIGWEAEKVKVRLYPHTTLADKHIDFLALDASIALRLDFDDATVVTEQDNSKSLTWGVCKQPWKAGDLLMLRISASPQNLTGVTNDASCGAPTPTASSGR